MQMYRTAIIASAAALAIVGLAGTAAAHSINSHVLDVRLPDGSVEHIRYVGDQPPAVSFAPLPDAPRFLPADRSLGVGSPFAMIDRISAMMDRDADAMLRKMSRLDRMAFDHPGVLSVDLRDLPPGAEGYSSVSTMSGGHVCTRTMEYDATGHGKPRVKTTVSGDCSGTASHTPALRTDHGSSSPKLIEAGYHPWPARTPHGSLLAYAKVN